MGKLCVHHRGDSSDSDRPENILPEIVPCFRLCAENGEQHRLRQQNGDAVEKRDCNSRPDAERGGVARFFALVRTKTAGNQAGAAQSEQVGKRRQEHEARHSERCRRDLQWIVELSDKERIRHVVNDRDKLADDRRNGQRQDRFPDRNIGKQRRPFSGHRFRLLPGAVHRSCSGPRSDSFHPRKRGSA